MSSKVLLDPERRSPEFMEFETDLRSRVVGQDRAVRRVSHIFQVVQTGMNTVGRPQGSFLFLGPTGTGKTHVVEAAAEILFGNPRAFIKVDCAEFQHGHEIAKLVGSPPGYLGHRETPSMLSQKALDEHHTQDRQFGFILFDEIEKAHDTLWKLLLGILDKGTLTLGDNKKVDFSKTVVFMTSNLGSKEIGQLISGKIGFRNKATDDSQSLDQSIYRTAMGVARRNFSPEFMNRIDKVVVFRTLSRRHLRQIIDLELRTVQERIVARESGTPFVLECTDRAKDFLLDEGWDPAYGARHLRRAIERYLVFPLSSLMATHQVRAGDIVSVDVSDDAGKLMFQREPMFRTAPRGADALVGLNEMVVQADYCPIPSAGGLRTEAR